MSVRVSVWKPRSTSAHPAPARVSGLQSSSRYVLCDERCMRTSRSGVVMGRNEPCAKASARCDLPASVKATPAPDPMVAARRPSLAFARRLRPSREQRPRASEIATRFEPARVKRDRYSISTRRGSNDSTDRAPGRKEDCTSRRATLHPPYEPPGRKAMEASGTGSLLRTNGDRRRPQVNAKAGVGGEKRALEADGRRQSRTEVAGEFELVAA